MVVGKEGVLSVAVDVELIIGLLNDIVVPVLLQHESHYHAFP
jgi:hypothetical protein